MRLLRFAAWLAWEPFARRSGKTSQAKWFANNLAFINHFLTSKDHGRVLGYDNSHGYHHRHFNGSTEAFDFIDYVAVFDCFVAEVRELRKERI